jgi:hypothetical protein
MIARFKNASNRWLEIKRLQWEFRSSERFQKQCERLQCFGVAELEQNYRKELARKIESLKQDQTPKLRVQ